MSKVTSTRTTLEEQMGLLTCTIQFTDIWDLSCRAECADRFWCWVVTVEYL